eukprot:21204-Heterococcus_DN1.PRE.2
MTVCAVDRKYAQHSFKGVSECALVYLSTTTPRVVHVIDQLKRHTAHDTLTASITASGRVVHSSVYNCSLSQMPAIAPCCTKAESFTLLAAAALSWLICLPVNNDDAFALKGYCTMH